MSLKIISLSRILGRQGIIKNYLLSKIKNNLREEDDYTGSCVTTNGERYYELDERTVSRIYNKRRYRELKI